MQLCATPYNTERPWWYFETAEEYHTKYDAEYKKYGTEEYEMQFIDGTAAESAIAQAVGLNQANVEMYMEFMDRGLWERQLAGAYNLLTNQHMSLSDVCAVDTGELDEGIIHETGEAYSEEKAIQAYAEEYIADGDMLSGLPENLRNYFDHEAYARDLRLNGDVTAFEFCDIWYVVQ